MPKSGSVGGLGDHGERLPHISCRGGFRTVVAYDPHRVLDPGEITHRRALWRIFQADTNMTASYNRVTDQRADIGTHTRDHPRRGACLFLQQG